MAETRSWGCQDFPERSLGPPIGASDRGGGGAEVACSQVAIVRWLLHETLTMVGRDVLQPTWVSRKNFPTRLFPILPSPVNAALPSAFFFMQRLARDTAEVVKLQEEVTQAQVAAIMVRSHAT
jgi:hypothetical protein